jgi:predicted DNA-binding transcriptional regulator AlpA
MKNELQKINHKLDLILNEVKKLQQSNSPPNTEETFTIQEAAKKLNLSKSRVYALIYEGKLIPLQREKYSRIQFNQSILNQYQNGKQ